MRTRIKICGLTREADVAAACDAGADAVGFVCYPHSPRFVGPGRLRALAAHVAPFVSPVLLFVNASEDEIDAALQQVPNALLQFHGDETELQCAWHRRPYLRAIRMGEGVDLLDCARRYASAAALLLDAPSDLYGGSGLSFDWARVPRERSRPIVLAGGLNSDNVERAVGSVQPYAVDVSSGVESAPGVKDALRIRKFVAAVRNAERQATPQAL